MKLVLDGRVAIPRMTGAGRYVVELARRLPGLTDELKVDLLLLPSMRATPIPAMLADAGGRGHYVNARIASARQWFVVPFVLQRLQPDVYHYPFMDMPFAGFPSIATIYDLNAILDPEYFGRFAWLKRPIARRLIGSTLRRSHVVLAISNATKRVIQQTYPESAHKVRTVYLGVDAAAWAAETRERLEVAELPDSDIPWPSRPYVLYVGVDRPHKNLVRLVRAFGRFRDANSWQRGAGPLLWLIGVGSGTDQLRSQISEAALGEDVRLESALDEGRVRRAYLGATLVAYVSTSEGFGLPILEAFAAGVPVVTAQRSSLPEVGGDAVVYVNPCEERSIAEALSRVWGDPALQRTLADRGRRRVQEFSWDATATATIEAYYDVLNRSP